MRVRCETLLLFDGVRQWALSLAYYDDGELYEVSLETLGGEARLVVNLALDKAWVHLGVRDVAFFDLDVDEALDKLAWMVNDMVVVARHEEA